MMLQFIEHKKIIVKNVSFLIILLSFFMPAAATSIISPVAGVWSNKQPLIINVPDGYDVFYSLSGSDPLESGFAYDGPVMLDVTGEIPLKVVTVAPNGSRTDETVWLTVKEDVQKLSSLLSILKLSKNAAYTVCTNQTKLNIPSKFKYSLNNSDEPYISGSVLSLDSKNAFSRYETLILSDETSLFRFMIYIQGNDTMEEPPVPPAPIKCDNWDYVSFTSDSRIQYSLDDGPWIEAKKAFYIDRSKNHTILWQYIPDEVIIADTVMPVEPVVIDTSMRGRIRKYILPPGSGLNKTELTETEDRSSFDKVTEEESNKTNHPVYYEIKTLELPAKPEFLGLPTSGITNEKVMLSLNQSGYLFRCLSDGFSPSFSKSLTIDCWTGCQFNMDLLFEVYYAGIYQGILSTSFIIDKKQPRLPKFTSTATDTYSRSSVLLQVEAESTVYYSIDKAVQSTTGFTDELIKKLVSSDINTVNRNYTPLDGRSILLPEKQKTAVLYCVHTFACDEAGNNSEDSSYYVVVDPVNYYIDTSLSTYDKATGSPSHPLSSITGILQSVISSSPFIRLFLSGEFNQDLPLIIKNDCEIIGKNDARIRFSDLTGFSINNADVTISGCLIELNSTLSKKISGPDTLYRKTLITGSEMKLSLDNCEIAVIYPTSGTVFMIDNSELNLRNCGITIKADSYSTIVTSDNSIVTLDSVRCSSVGETSLIFSMNDGVINTKNSTCTVTAVLGRIAELSGTKYSFVNNRFVSNNLLNSGTGFTPDNQPIWTDKESILVENKGNVYE